MEFNEIKVGQCISSSNRKRFFIILEKTPTNVTYLTVEYLECRSYYPYYPGVDFHITTLSKDKYSSGYLSAKSTQPIKNNDFAFKKIFNWLFKEDLFFSI